MSVPVFLIFSPLKLWGDIIIVPQLLAVLTVSMAFSRLPWAVAGCMNVQTAAICTSGGINCLLFWIYLGKNYAWFFCNINWVIFQNTWGFLLKVWFHSRTILFTESKKKIFLLYSLLNKYLETYTSPRLLLTRTVWEDTVLPSYPKVLAGPPVAPASCLSSS